jgi:sensor histidine kinase YesM
MKKIVSSKIFVHTGFCMAVIALSWFAIHFYIGDMRSNEAQLGYIATLYFFICVYTGHWLCQTWLLKNKFGLFLLYAILACIILIVAGGLLVQARFHLHNRSFTDFLLRISPFFVISLVIGIFLKLARSALQKQVQDAKASAEQKQSELNLLQSQLSPHFLFNTLNNMYGLSISQQDKIPGLLLKLSDLLRYSVYTTKELFVPLTEELTYIRNYIDFEKIRIGDRLVLTTAIEDTADTTIKIAPMVLIVFIENAFKHARDTLDQKIHIDIALKIVDNFIAFAVKNSHQIIRYAGKSEEDKSGLGLVNTIKRLELLYPSEYALEQQNEEKFYSVALRLKVKL